MKSLGAAGVPMDFAEVLPALQNKTLDGIRSNAAVMAGAKFFTVAKFLTNVRDTMIPSAGMVSTTFLNKLPADLRKAVEDAGKDCEGPMLGVAVRFDQNATKIWADNGAEIINLSPADKAAFMKRAQAVGDEVLGGDPQTKDLYALLKKVAEKHRKKS
jgi:TRAP-type C4-dicarboxylate transport system substrate-binding protein